MKMKVIIIFVLVLLVVAAGAVWFVLPQRCVAICELSFSLDNTNKVVRTDVGESDSLDQLAFRVQSAMAYLDFDESVESMADSLIREMPRLPGGKKRANDLVKGLDFQLRTKPEISLTVMAEANTAESALIVLRTYASTVSRHFKEEREGLLLKISAWFDQEKAWKIRRGENVKTWDDAKKRALNDAVVNSVKVQMVKEPTVLSLGKDFPIWRRDRNKRSPR